jgi:hypothetical protein
VGGLFSPLDEELGLLPGSLTPLLHERLVCAGAAAKSFLEAARVFHMFTRTPLSEPTARRFTERAGAVMEECESEEEIPQAPDGVGDARPFWVGADGMFVRLVGGAWREVRTVTIGRVNPAKAEDGQERVRTTDLSYFSRLTDGADAFIDLAGVEFRRRGVPDAALVGAGSDGANWCQQTFDRYCPQAKRSLDFYHATGRVKEVGRLVWPGSPGMAEHYASSHLHRLKHHGPVSLLPSLGVWSALAPGAAAREKIGGHYQYFADREQLLDYPGVRALGLPIGTGNAESANVHVIQQRLKGPGKFWAIEHVNPMLALRGALCSERWEAAWQVAAVRLSKGHYPTRAFHAPRAKN